MIAPACTYLPARTASVTSADLIQGIEAAALATASQIAVQCLRRLPEQRRGQVVHRVAGEIILLVLYGFTRRVSLAENHQRRIDADTRPLPGICVDLR
jgi:hypothetical protein